MERIEDQMEFLLSAALYRCGNIADAEDLTQETLLAALLLQERGGQIDNLRGWMVTVMERKYYDMLRKRYRQPAVSIDEMFETSGAASCPEDWLARETAAEEAVRVRREVAFLAQMYREVIVRRYMDGQSIAEIAEALAAMGHEVEVIDDRINMGRGQIIWRTENGLLIGGTEPRCDGTVAAW